MGPFITHETALRRMTVVDGDYDETDHLRSTPSHFSLFWERRIFSIAVASWAECTTSEAPEKQLQALFPPHPILPCLETYLLMLNWRSMLKSYLKFWKSCRSQGKAGPLFTQKLAPLQNSWKVNTFQNFKYDFNMGDQFSVFSVGYRWMATGRRLEGPSALLISTNGH